MGLIFRNARLFILNASISCIRGLYAVEHLIVFVWNSNGCHYNHEIFVFLNVLKIKSNSNREINVNR